MNIVISGIQASGKGTQAKILCDDLNLAHVSVGEVIAWALSEKPELVAPYTKEDYTSGKLADDEVLFKVVRYVLDPLKDSKFSGYVLDGFPRTKAQVDFLLENYPPDVWFLLELDRVNAIKRMAIRLRPDDNPDSIDRRLESYYNETLPAIEGYSDLDRVSCVRSDGQEKSVYELNAELMNILDSRINSVEQETE